MTELLEQDRVYEIRRANLPKLEERMAKLAAKARKYGIPEPTLEILSEGHRKIVRRDQAGWETGYVKPVAVVRLTGEVPRLEGGWRLVGIVDHRSKPGDVGYIVAQLPWTAQDQIEVPAPYRFDDPQCDHCETVRRRSDTFVLLSEDGEWKRVGRQCMKDYLRDQTADQYARWLYDLQSIPWGEYGDIDYKDHWVETPTLLALAALMIEKHGWRSRRDENMGEGTSTATRALNWLSDYPERRVEKLEKRHYEQADAALAWLTQEIGSQDRERLNGYLHNLLVAASRSENHVKHAGLVASLIWTWQRETDRADEAEREAAKPSEHVGKLKERMDLALTVVRRLDLSVDPYSYYGSDVLYIHIMEDADGNVFVWKTQAERMAEGETYNVRGTVKEHGDYQGTRQTVLTRCKITCAKCSSNNYWWDKQDGYHCSGCAMLEKQEHL